MKEKFIQNGKRVYQFNVGNGNAKISATQIVNEVIVEEVPKMMSPDPIPYTYYVSRGREKAIIDRIKKRTNTTSKWDWWNWKDNNCKENI